MATATARSKQSSSDVTEFEFRCTRKKCRNEQWVKGVGPVDGNFILGSDADFCRECGKGSVRATGLRRTILAKKNDRGAIEVLEMERVYKVHGHTWSCGISHSLWDQGEAAEDAGKMGIWPLDGTTKVLGPDARVRVTMVVEVLDVGKRQKPWCELAGKKCRSCGTNKADPGKMHIGIEKGYSLDYILCRRFEGKRPIDWPKGNDFVHESHVERADCPECLSAFEKLKEARRREKAKPDEEE